MAANYLGHAYFRGSKNYKLAARFYHMAAKGDVVGAQHQLGIMYAKNQGLDLLDGPLTLQINGEIIATGSGRNADGGMTIY